MKKTESISEHADTKHIFTVWIISPNNLKQVTTILA